MLVFKGKLKEHPRWEVENELYRFRNRVFSDRLGWDVDLTVVWSRTVSIPRTPIGF